MAGEIDHTWFIRPKMKKTRKKTRKKIKKDKKTRKKMKKMKKDKKDNKDKKDKIVDIPFSKYKSKGTRATKGDIRFHYQEYINIPNFFRSLNFKVNYNNEIIKLVSINNEILIQEIPLLSFDKKFTIVIINLHIKDGDHANVALVNNINRTIEYFEPHGHRKNKNSEIEGHKGIYIQKVNILKDLFKKLLPEHGFLNITEYIKKTSFQTLLDPDENSGFCVIWCILFVHYRLLNPRVLLSRLMFHIDKVITTPKLLKYAKHVEDVCKGKQM
jgi:hypothetical protein